MVAQDVIQQVRRLVVPVLILAGGVGGLYWLSTLNAPPDRVEVPSQLPLVETGLVATHTDSFPIQVHGVVVPFREIRIEAQVEGRIVEKADELRSGHFVRAESPLLTIDPEPYQIEIAKLGHEAQQAATDHERVTLEIKQVETLLGLAERQLLLATRELARSDKLLEMKVTSPAERDRSERAELEVKVKLAVLKNRRDQLPLQQSVLQSQHDVIKQRAKQAALDLKRTQIIAPLDAIVTADPQEAGSYVEPGDHLLTLQDPSQFEVACRLSSDELFWLYESANASRDADARKAAFELPETSATVAYETAGEVFTWAGRISRADGSGFDETTRTLACRVLVGQPIRDADSGPPTLIEGMFVRVQIDVTPRTELLALPRAALQPDGHVWVISDGKLTIHRVRTVRVTESIVLLRADRTTIKPGSRVVVSTLPIVFDGMDVRERPVP